MDLIWAVPAVFCVIGAVVLLVGFRSITLTADELRAQLQRFDEVRVAVAELRSSGLTTQATVERLRNRP